LGPLHLFGFTAPNATTLSTLPRNKSNPSVIFPPPKEKKKNKLEKSKIKVRGSFHQLKHSGKGHYGNGAKVL
jgi:hypothetical protein